jgi:hypothetical protein
VQVLSAFPPGCAFNCDFVDRTRAWVRPDEHTIDLQVEIEDLPHVGSLVIHQETVVAMVHALGWKLEDEDHSGELLRVVALNEELHRENQALRAALARLGKDTTSIPRVMAGT